MNPESPSALALAYATRSRRELDQSSAILAESAGLPDPSPSLEVRDRGIRLKAEMLDKLMAAGDNRSVRIAILKNYHYLMGSSLIADKLSQEAQVLSAEGDVEGEGFEQASRSLAERNNDVILDEETLEYSYNHILRQVENARIIAAEHGVNPEQAFEDDNLYEEIIRRSYTPTEFVVRTLHSMTIATPQALAEFVVDMWLALESGPSRPNVMMSLDPKEKEEFVSEVLRSRPDLKEMVEEIALNSNRAMGQRVLGDIQRFWGSEAVNMLDPKLRIAMLFPEDI